MSGQCVVLGMPMGTSFCGNLTALAQGAACLPPSILQDAHPASLLGPLALGYQLGWGLYCILATQVYLYTQLVYSDHWTLQLVVYVVFALETSQTALATHDSWFQFHAGTTGLGFTWLTAIILTGTISAMIQCFYAWRIHQLGGSIYLSGGIVAIAAMQMISAIIEGVSIKLHGTSPMPLLQTLVTSNVGLAWLVGTAACDLIICSSMVRLLHTKHTTFAQTQRLMRKLMVRVVESGTMTAIIALSMLVLVNQRQDGYAAALALGMSKLYGISLLVLLLNRPSVSVRAGRDFMGGRIGAACWRDGIRVDIAQEVCIDWVP